MTDLEQLLAPPSIRTRLTVTEICERYGISKTAYWKELAQHLDRVAITRYVSGHYQDDVERLLEERSIREFFVTEERPRRGAATEPAELKQAIQGLSPAERERLLAAVTA